MAASDSEALGFLPSLIIGFGHAGKMHGRCIAKARRRLGRHEVMNPAPVFIIDTALERDLDGAPQEYQVIRSLYELPPDFRAHLVAHVCTPPNVRADVIQAVLAAGLRRLVVEKPLAADPDEMSRLAALTAAHRPDLLVVANWTTSNLTREVQSLIEQRQSRVASIEIIQRKCRISRSTGNRGHGSAFEVEVPHMVALAQMLAGPHLTVSQARAWGMAIGGCNIPDMGGAELLLDGDGGLTVKIHADHLAPIIERTIRVQFQDGGWLEGYYPCTGLDLYSQLKDYDNNGELVMHKYMEDDTLTQFFAEAYAYFIGHGVRPVSDFDFSARVCNVLHEAKRLNVQRSYGALTPCR
jgi:predicted dehydrogenase